MPGELTVLMPPAPLSSSDPLVAVPTATASSMPTSKPIGASAVLHDVGATIALAPPTLGASSTLPSRTSDLATLNGDTTLKSTRKSKRKKKGSMSETTPLILKANGRSSPTEEDVHPLPWFRSPPKARKSPPANKQGSRDQRRGTQEQTSLCNSIMSKLCCGVISSDNDADLEYGLATRYSTDGEQFESEGFKQCVQFLVGLIVVVAAVLIIMIIFQPFQHESSLW